MNPQLRSLLEVCLSLRFRWSRREIRAARWEWLEAESACTARTPGRPPVRFRVPLVPA